MSSRAEFEAALEAILFVTADPVPAERLMAAFDEGEREEARAALEALRERYRTQEGRGVFLEEVAGGFRIVTSPEQHPYLRRFFEASGANRLSMAALETLAIVAYRQPVTAPEIQELRGKNSSAALKTLLERRMVRISGRKDVVGRPFIYATTREFLMHFGLRDLGELPPLEEFEESFGGGEDASEAAPAIARDHQAIGLLSSEEAEVSLGVEGFEVHAPAVAAGALASSEPGTGESEEAEIDAPGSEAGQRAGRED